MKVEKNCFLYYREVVVKFPVLKLNRLDVSPVSATF